MLCCGADRGLGRWGPLIAAVSVVCVAFYIYQPLDNRNYGGMTSGFRWAFWMAPLWLLAMQPVADWAGQRRWSQIGARRPAWAIRSVSGLSLSEILDAALAVGWCWKVFLLSSVKMLIGHGVDGMPSQA